MVTQSDPDLGVISFALSLLASLSGFKAAKRPSVTTLRRHRCVLGTAAAVVTTNYWFVLVYMSLPLTFMLYLVIGGAFWAMLGIVGIRIVNQMLGCDIGKDIEEWGFGSPGRSDEW